MLNLHRTFALITCVLIAAAILSYASIPVSLAQNSTSQATIVGQVNVNGVATNGVSVTCGPGSATTSSYNGVDGVFVISGLPYGTSLPFSARYQGQTYTDVIDPLSTGQQYFEIPAIEMTTAASTATPVANATVTPTPNSTATPTPNATATPTPNATATPAPNSTVTPTATATATPTPTATATPAPEPTAAQTQATPEAPPQTVQSVASPPAVPAPSPALANPSPTQEVKQSIDGDPLAAETGPGKETATSEPLVTPAPGTATARSPGFTGALALLALLGIALLAVVKLR